MLCSRFLKIFSLFYNRSSKIINYAQFKKFFVSVIRDCFDLILVVHFLPQGFLWSAQLHPFLVGLLGSISSILLGYTLT
jgi:hypothetical protein